MGNIAILPRRKAALCPICRKPSSARFRPFCSKHCADIDLGRWLGEEYRVPTNERPEPEASENGEKSEGGD